MDELDKLRTLAGLEKTDNNSEGSNISITGTQKAEIMRTHNIRPGSQEWFRLWFSKPYLTGETPVADK